MGKKKQKSTAGILSTSYGKGNFQAEGTEYKTKNISNNEMKSTENEVKITYVIKVQ